MLATGPLTAFSDSSSIATGLATVALSRLTCVAFLVSVAIIVQARWVSMRSQYASWAHSGNIVMNAVFQYVGPGLVCLLLLMIADHPRLFNGTNMLCHLVHPDEKIIPPCRIFFDESTRLCVFHSDGSSPHMDMTSPVAPFRRLGDITFHVPFCTQRMC